MKYWFFNGNDVLGPLAAHELAAQPGFSAASMICAEDASEDAAGWQAASSFPAFRFNSATGKLDRLTGVQPVVLLKKPAVPKIASVETEVPIQASCTIPVLEPRRPLPPLCKPAVAVRRKMIKPTIRPKVAVGIVKPAAVLENALAQKLGAPLAAPVAPVVRQPALVAASVSAPAAVTTATAPKAVITSVNLSTDSAQSLALADGPAVSTAPAEVYVPREIDPYEPTPQELPPPSQIPSVSEAPESAAADELSARWKDNFSLFSMPVELEESSWGMQKWLCAVIILLVGGGWILFHSGWWKQHVAGITSAPAAASVSAAAAFTAQQALRAVQQYPLAENTVSGYLSAAYPDVQPDAWSVAPLQNGGYLVEYKGVLPPTAETVIYQFRVSGAGELIRGANAAATDLLESSTSQEN